MRCLVLTPDPRFAQALTRDGPGEVTFLPVADTAAAIRLLHGVHVQAGVLDSATPPAAAAEFLHWWRTSPQRLGQPLVLAGSGPAASLPAGVRPSERTPAAVGRALTEAAPLLLDPLRRELRGHDARIALTPSETALLHHLCRALTPVPTDELARVALGYADRAGAPVVRTHLSNLRRKCAAAGLPDPIGGRRGHGYWALGVRLRD